MAEDMSNPSMAALLAEFIELIDWTVKKDMPRDDKLEIMRDTLEDVTDDLKNKCSRWKTATEQAEDGARQTAERNEELEKMKREMAAKIEKLEDDERRRVEEDKQSEERRRQMEEQLSRRTIELATKERLYDEKKLEQEMRERLLQQQSVNLEQTGKKNKIEQAGIAQEAKAVELDKSKLEQSSNILQAKVEADKEADIRRVRWEEGLRRREDSLKLAHQSVLALNGTVDKNLAAIREEHAENKKLLAVIKEKHQRMRKLKDDLGHTSDACMRHLVTIGNGLGVIHKFEDKHAAILASLREEITVLSTALDKQAEQAKSIPMAIQVAENEYEKLVTDTERRLRRVSASISTSSTKLDAVSTKVDKVLANSSQLEAVSTKIDAVTANSSQLEAVSTAIDKVTNASSQLVAASTKIGNVTEDSGRLDGISSKIDNVTNIGNGLDELSTRLQAFQPAVIETLQEITEAASKAKADASKTKADCQRSLVNQSVSRYDQSRAKRGLGSPVRPVSKRRRQNSVGSAGMLTNVGPPKPLPADIVERIPSPTGRGRVVVYENRRRVDTSPSRNTPSGAQGPFESQNGSSATDQIVNPVASSPGTLLQSSQSNPSATDPQGFAQASDEIKSVWAQIEFPEKWTPTASNVLFQGLQRATGKKLQPRSRPAGLLDASAALPNCFLCRVSKMKSVLDNGDKPCSNCKTKGYDCVHVSFVDDGLADSEYDPDRQEKRWKLTIREG